MSWLLGRDLVTPFQIDIYRTAKAAGWLPLLWLAVVVARRSAKRRCFAAFSFAAGCNRRATPGRSSSLSVAAVGAHPVQYDWYVIGQVFAFGLLLGWVRWATGSTLLTILLHGMINLEGMIETVLAVSS